MEMILGLIIGLGLSAACGFRVFVPLLGMSLAVLSGYMTVAAGFEWIGSWAALIAFATATVLEIGAYYSPWLDNLLDTLMSPAAVVAGTILTASMLGDSSPFLQWALAIIAGGGVAAIVQSGTVALRAGSTGTTGGLANMGISTIELGGSVLFTVLAILIPVVGILAVIWLCYRIIIRMKNSNILKRSLRR